jgi:type I restriction enzyme S subunit
MSHSSLPPGWHQTKLEALQAPGDYTFVGGPFGSDLTTQDYIAEPGVPVIRGTNLGGSESRFVDDGFVFASEAKAASLHRNMAYPGDLIFTQRGTLGQVAVIPIQARFPRYVISQSQMKLTVDSSKADSRFVYYAFRSPKSQAILLSRTQATGVPHINLGILKDFTIPLPPLPEQQRIADILDKAEGIRRKRREAKLLSSDLPLAIFRDTFEGNLTSATTRSLADVAEVVSGVAKGRHLNGQRTREVPYLRVANVQAGYLDLSEIKTIPATEAEIAELTLQRGDVLLTEGGDHDKLGRGALWEHDVKDCIHQNHVFRVRTNRDLLSPTVFVYFLQTERAKGYFLKCAKKTTNLATINMRQLRALPVPVPPPQLQRRFEKELPPARDLIARQTTAGEQADDLFKALVQRAFRGEL